MAESAAVPKEEYALPRSATITICDQAAIPNGVVDVEPNVGRILFVNQDNTHYRLRFWRENTAPTDGIDVVLVAGGTLTIAIKTDDSFYYAVLDDAGMTKGGFETDLEKYANGPIRN
jgi:hypothetical protein